MGACTRSDHSTVSALLDAGADPNAKGIDDSTTLHWAAERGSLTIIAALLGAGAT